MTLSWKELACHGLLVEFGEPSLVKDLLKMAMKERWLFLEEEAREFHSENIGSVINIYICPHYAGPLAPGGVLQNILRAY